MRLRYQVASSLDGYIAGPNGEFDWIVMDPDVDFAALYAQFGTVVMGANTFRAGMEQGMDGSMPGLDVFVYSRTLQQKDHPKVTVIDSDPVEHVRTLKAKGGKDIWLFGGGALFRTLLEGGLVDTVEPAVVPVLLGAGIPMLPGPELRARLTLTSHRLYAKSGTMLLEYAVNAS
jgi:dihydrofolate reductase